MSPPLKPVILLADDDEDDKVMLKDAFGDAGFTGSIYSVGDGAGLLDYLNKKGRFLNEECPRPHIIILDLNMPKVDGRLALRHIKADSKLRNIPVIILTTSTSLEDVANAYSYGANTFITKPAIYADLVKIAKHMNQYWFEIAVLTG